MVLVLQGTCTLVMDGGQYPMQAGQAAAFPAGRADGHHFVNRGREPARFLVAGTKAQSETATYSDVDLKIEIAGGTATFTRRDGTPFVATEADHHLPAHGRQGLPAGLIRSDWQDEPDPVHPVLGAGCGPDRTQPLSDPGGLTQFGARIVELRPGSRSGHRHLHEAADEFIYMLDGHAVLVEDGETPLGPGDAAAWPAGLGVGHRLDNRSDHPARYLVIGTRAATDRIHYSDHDLITETAGPARRHLRRDGSLIKETP